MHDSGTMRESLDWVIDGYPDELLCLLKKQAGKRLPAQREKMIPKLAEALLRPERVDAMLAGADGGELALLAFMARAGGQPRIGAVDWWLRRRGGAEPSTTLQSLVERGLVFHVASTSKPTRDSNDDDAGLDPEWTLLPAGRLWVPDEIAAKAVDIEPEPPLPVAPGSHEKRRAAPGEVIRELFLLARFIDERRPEVLSTSRSLGQTDFVDLAAAVDDGDRYKHARRLEEAPGLMWLVAIALQAEVAAISEQRLRPCAHADEFFSVGLQRQASWLLDAAIAQTRWGELETSASVVLEKPPALSRDGSDLPGPGRRVGARRKLVDVLARIATPGTWHSVGAFAEGMMRANPDFLIRRHAPRWNGAVTEPEYRGILSLGASDPEPVGMWDGWSAVEGVFIEQFIVEALARIGLVEVGDGADGVVFRITELGAAALSSDDAPIDEPDDAPGRFFVQPNFEIIADGGGDNIGTVWRLSRVAELTSFDRAAMLHITQASVTAGFEGGMTREQITTTLNDHGRVTVPQNVAFSIDEWVDAFERYELRHGAWILEADTPEELDEFDADCLERLGPTAARVLAGGRDRIEEQLAERMDARVVDHAAGVADAFRLGLSMQAEPIEAKWHWYVSHLLGHVADLDEATGHYQLSRDAVRRGLDLGVDPRDVEGFLEAGVEGAPSAEQVLKIRGWLGRYGDAQLDEVTVLSLPPDAVADVLSVPRVREAVVGSLGGSVFVVKPELAEDLREFLNDAGVDIGAMPTSTDDVPVSLVQTRSAAAQAWGRRRWEAGDAEAERTQLVNDAVESGQRVLVLYQSVLKGEHPSEWTLSPRVLERSRWGQERLQAYCHSRESHRTFDVGRMDRIVLLDEPAQWPDDVSGAGKQERR